MSENFRWQGYGTADIYDAQDCVLIAIKNGEAIKSELLQRIPPERAHLLSFVAQKAGIPLENGTYLQLSAEVERVGSRGKLGDWWRL